MQIQDAINAAVPAISTREGVIAYYKEQFPGLVRGKEEWKSRLAADLEPITGLSKASLMRRFQSGRENSKLSAKAKKEYEELGDALPPVAPKKGFTLEAGSVLWVQFSESCEKRTVKHDLNVPPTAAKAIVAESLSGGGQQILVNLYMHQRWNAKKPKASPCDEPDISLRANK